MHDRGNMNVQAGLIVCRVSASPSRNPQTHYRMLVGGNQAWEGIGVSHARDWPADAFRQTRPLHELVMKLLVLMEEEQELAVRGLAEEGQGVRLGPGSWLSVI